MLNGLKRESQHFLHNFQKITILRELHKSFGEIYLGGKKINLLICSSFWQISQLIARWMPVNLMGCYILCCLNNPLQITYLTWLMEMKNILYLIMCLRILPSQLEKHEHVLLVKPKNLPKYLRTYNLFYLWKIVK